MVLACYESTTNSALLFRIGLCGFDNPMRDPKTEDLKKHIGHVSVHNLVQMLSICLAVCLLSHSFYVVYL